MKYREIELLARKTYDADAVETIDLDMKDPISQIQIQHESYNTGTGSATGHPAGCVTDITLKDGSDILYNLSGFQAVAADFYSNNRVPFHRLQTTDNNSSIVTYNLNFGRKLWDKELALDPSNFSNLQLQVTTDLDVGMCTPDAGYLTATASLFDEKKIEPVGFFTHKEHKTYSGGSATHERVSLPTDNAYRMLMFKCLVADHAPDELYNIIKIEEDNGKKVPFDLTIEQIAYMTTQKWIPFVERTRVAGTTTARTVYSTPTWWRNFSMAGHHSAVALYGSCYGSFGNSYTFISSTAGPNQTIQCEGYAPNGAIAIPFGDLQDLDDWYDVEDVESLVIDTLNKSDGSGQTFEIFSQQLRKY